MKNQTLEYIGASLENTTVDPELQYVPYPLRIETYVVPIIFALIFVVSNIFSTVLGFEVDI